MRLVSVTKVRWKVFHPCHRCSCISYLSYLPPVKGWLGPLCDQQEPTNMARNGIATQSSTCWDGPASRAINGNKNQAWGGNSITHTCEEESPWLEVDLGVEKTIAHVILYNRWDECCRDRFNDSELQVLDIARNVVSSQTIINSISTNHFYFDNVSGRYVRVQKTGQGSLTIAEIEVYDGALACSNCSTLDSDCHVAPRCNSDGSCSTQSTSFVANGTPCNSKPFGTCLDGQCVEPETSAPTPEPTLAPFTLTPTQFLLSDRFNLAAGGQASQSTTCHGGAAGRAIDGNSNGYHSYLPRS